MNTTYEQVLESFESTFQHKTQLPSELIEQWFKDSVSEYELEIEELDYNWSGSEFNKELKQYEIRSIALMMKIKYCTRELSRVNKLNNIIGKDLSLNSTGDSKKYTMSELINEIENLKELLGKQKTTAYL